MDLPKVSQCPSFSFLSSIWRQERQFWKLAATFTVLEDQELGGHDNRLVTPTAASKRRSIVFCQEYCYCYCYCLDNQILLALELLLLVVVLLHSTPTATLRIYYYYWKWINRSSGRSKVDDCADCKDCSIATSPMPLVSIYCPIL